MVGFDCDLDHVAVLALAVLLDVDAGEELQIRLIGVDGVVPTCSDEVPDLGADPLPVPVYAADALQNRLPN